MRDPGEDVAVLAEKYGGLYLDEDGLFALREQLEDAKEGLKAGNLHAVRRALDEIERMVG